jgi:flavin reductase (DIM6/NTAB) family NADH-FMN oxidoreductase RutF
MKKEINNTEAIFPMPVLMVATYNEDDSVNVMNAAWGSMLSRDHIMLKLTKTHKTVENIMNRKAFTVSIADSKHVVEADYFGVVSGNDTSDKFEKSGLTSVKSENIDAPIINEFPICFECEFIEYQDSQYGCGVVAKVINMMAEDSVFDGDTIDINKVEAIAFDPYTHGYYKVQERVGEAFKDGLKLK